MYTFLIDTLIGFYSLEPIIKRIVVEKKKFFVLCKKEHYEFIKNNINSSLVEYLFIEELFKYRYLKSIHRIILHFITDQNYSWIYYKKVNSVTLKYDFKKRFIFNLGKIVPKTSNSQVNSKLVGLLDKIVPMMFPTKKIIVTSFNLYPEYLCKSCYDITTIMESWDHPVKAPVGYKSNKVITWNRDLAQDWMNNQGDPNVYPVYPLKLRYPIEEILKKFVRNRTNIQKNKCVYAVASTAKYQEKSLVNLEKKIITELCIVTKRLGWELHLKPRPNGLKNEFDSFKKLYNHVSVGYMMESTGLASNYFFSEEYNQNRFKEVIDADLVINCFTTFGLDCAACGIPVLQLDLSNTYGLEDSKYFYNNYHIKKYLINNTENILSIRNKSLTEGLIEYLQNRKNIETKYSSEIRKWLNVNKEFNESINMILGIIDDKYE